MNAFGIDVFSGDLTDSYKNTPIILLEVNSCPGIFFNIDGKSIRLSNSYLDRLYSVFSHRCVCKKIYCLL